MKDAMALPISDELLRQVFYIFTNVQTYPLLMMSWRKVDPVHRKMEEIWLLHQYPFFQPTES